MKAIAVDDVLKFKYLSEISFSPEGGSACFVMTEADRKNNGYKSYLYLWRGGKFVKLTSGGKERRFQYLDERTILFPGNREEEGDKKEPDLTSRWYEISLDGGEARLAYTFPVPVSKVMPLPGGDLILQGSTMPGFEDLHLGDKKLLAQFKKHMKDNADYEVIEQVPWWWNGGGHTRGAYDSLYYYDHKKKALRRLTELGESVMETRLSADGSLIYYMSSPVKPLLPMMGETKLKRLDIASG